MNLTWLKMAMAIALLTVGAMTATCTPGHLDLTQSPSAATTGAPERTCTPDGQDQILVPKDECVEMIVDDPSPF